MLSKTAWFLAATWSLAVIGGSLAICRSFRVLARNREAKHTVGKALRQRLRRLCRRFGLFVAADRARILALGVGIAVDELDDRHRRIVAVAEAGLDDAGIAARPSGVTLGEGGHQLVGENLILKPGDREAPGMQPALL